MCPTCCTQIVNIYVENCFKNMGIDLSYFWFISFPGQFLSLSLFWCVISVPRGFFSSQYPDGYFSNIRDAFSFHEYFSLYLDDFSFYLVDYLYILMVPIYILIVRPSKRFCLSIPEDLSFYPDLSLSIFMVSVSIIWLSSLSLNISQSW